MLTKIYEELVTIRKELQTIRGVMESFQPKKEPISKNACKISQDKMPNSFYKKYYSTSTF